jgi:hypothetical protein
LCALLNSAAANWLVRSHSVAGGKGFGTPGTMDFLPLRRFAPERGEHNELAALSEEAHRAARLGGDAREIERAVDTLAARVFGIGDAEAAGIAAETRGCMRGTGPGETPAVRRT